MKPEENYIEINRKSWNNRTETHIDSEFYDMTSFMQGATSLNSIETELLGDIKGKSILHLQCHFGQDSISLSRLGAKVTGVDLSDLSIKKAKELAQELQVDTQFICCDIYDLENHLNQKFDYIFTSYGVIGWLPDLDRWATIIHHFLKPGAQLVFVEFHPVVWMFDDDFKLVKYNYFNDGPIHENEEGTYANKEAEISQEYVTWNHSLSEVMTSLINHDLQINSFQEFNYSPYNCFNHTKKIDQNKYIIEHLNQKIPMVYAIKATKK